MVKSVYAVILYQVFVTVIILLVSIIIIIHTSYKYISVILIYVSILSSLCTMRKPSAVVALPRCEWMISYWLRWSYSLTLSSSTCSRSTCRQSIPLPTINLLLQQHQQLRHLQEKNEQFYALKDCYSSIVSNAIVIISIPWPIKIPPPPLGSTSIIRRDNILRKFHNIICIYFYCI